MLHAAIGLRFGHVGIVLTTLLSAIPVVLIAMLFVQIGLDDDVKRPSPRA